MQPKAGPPAEPALGFSVRLPNFLNPLLVHPEQHHRAALQLHVVLVRADYRTLIGLASGLQLQIRDPDYALRFRSDRSTRAALGIGRRIAATG